MGGWRASVWPASTHWVTSDSRMQELKGQLLCHAWVGKEGIKKIMHLDVTCEFICPAVQMSSRAITFRVEKVSLWIVSWPLKV